MDGGVFAGAWGKYRRRWKHGAERGTRGVEGGSGTGEGEVRTVGRVLWGSGGMGEERAVVRVLRIEDIGRTDVRAVVSMTIAMHERVLSGFP